MLYVSLLWSFKNLKKFNSETIKLYVDIIQIFRFFLYFSGRSGHRGHSPILRTTRFLYWLKVTWLTPQFRLIIRLLLIISDQFLLTSSPEMPLFFWKSIAIFITHIIWVLYMFQFVQNLSLVLTVAYFLLFTIVYYNCSWMFRDLKEIKQNNL